MSAKPRTKSQTAKMPTGKAKAKGQMGKQTDDERTVAVQTRHQTAANDTTNKRAASTPTPKKRTTRNVRPTSSQPRRRSLNRKHAMRGLSRKQKKTVITEKDTTKNQATNKRTAKTRGDYRARLLSAPPGEHILAENYSIIPRGEHHLNYVVRLLALRCDKIQKLCKANKDSMYACSILPVARLLAC